MRIRSLTVLAILGLVSCTQGNTPKPWGNRGPEQPFEDYVYGLETKYKREAIRNGIDVHFSAIPPSSDHQVRIRVTYDNKSDPTLAGSIADAAVELAKRIKRENPALRDMDIKFERVVEHRDE